MNEGRVRAWSMAILGIVLIAGYLCSLWQPQAARRLAQAHSREIWFLEITTPTARVEDHAETTTPAIERLLRSRAYVRDLHFSTRRDKVIGFFLSDGDAAHADISGDLRNSLEAMRASGSDFSYVLFGQPLDSTREAPVFAGTAQSILQDLARQGDAPSALELAKPDIVLMPKPGATQPTPATLDLLLQRVQALPGIELVFARNARVPILHLTFDPRDLLRRGLNPLTLQRTLNDHFATSQAQDVTSFARMTKVFEQKARTEEELCSLSFPTKDGRTLLRICDVARPTWREVLVERYLAETPADDFVRSFSWESMQGKPPRIDVVLSPSTVPAEALDQIRTALDDLRLNSQWEPTPSKSGWNPVSLLVMGALAILLVLPLSALEPRFVLPVKSIPMAFALWISLLLGLSLAPDLQLTLLFVTALIVAASARYLWNTLPAGGKSWSVVLGSVVCLPMLGTGVWLSARFTQQTTNGVESLLALVTLLLPFLTVLLFPGVSRPVPHCRNFWRFGKGRTVLLTVVASGLFLASHRRIDRETLWLQLGTDTTQDAFHVAGLVGELERISSAEGARMRFLGVETARDVEIVPTRFALMNRVPIRAEEVIQSLQPTLVGHLPVPGGRLQERIPIVLEGAVTSVSSGVLEDFHEWLHTAQQPLSFKPGNPENFVALSALVEPSWRQFLKSIPSSGDGFVTLVEIRGANEKVRFEVPRAIARFRNGSARNLRHTLQDSATFRAGVQSSNLSSKATLSLFAMVVGGVFFASMQRAFLAGATYVIIDLLCSTIFVVIGPANATTFPAPATWTAICLLVCWFIMLKTSDSRRAANLSLDDAFGPCLTVSRELRRWAGALTATTFLLGFFMPNLLLVSAGFACLWLIVGWFLPDWMLVLTHLNEIMHRWGLRTRIRLAAWLTTTIVLALSNLQTFEARAETSTSLVDARCGTTAALILPIIGRPKGKEPAPQKAIFSERLAQEIPCSWSSSSLTSELTEILESLREPSQQGAVLDRMRSLVTDKRPFLEEEISRKVPGHLGARLVERRIYGGFYEEFYGNIAFTIIDFRKEGEPIIAKMTVSEENQTQGVAAIAGYLRGESTKFYEEFLGESVRLPIYVEKVESLDRHPVSENLAGEMDLFLRSRFLYPISFDWFERKTFFRSERDPTKARYSLNVKIRRDGTRFYSSITTLSKENHQRRTAWIEGDISRMPAFEEEVLALSKRTLTSLEGITDYCVALAFDFWTDVRRTTRMYGLAFRQNLGNAATSLRLRSGEHAANDNGSRFSLLSLGGAVGWQFVDLRWFGADVGLGLDAGLASRSDKGSSARALFLTAGPYAQGQLLLRGNFAGMARIGIEQPQLFGSETLRKSVFDTFYANFQLGLGVTF